MARAGAGLATRFDFSSLRGEASKLHRVLEIDVDGFVYAERADLSSRSFEPSLATSTVTSSGSTLIRVS